MNAGNSQRADASTISNGIQNVYMNTLHVTHPAPSQSCFFNCNKVITKSHKETHLTHVSAAYYPVLPFVFSYKLNHLRTIQKTTNIYNGTEQAFTHFNIKNPYLCTFAKNTVRF
jgi:hypothetical protein